MHHRDAREVLSSSIPSSAFFGVVGTDCIGRHLDMKEECLIAIAVRGSVL